MGLPVSVSDPSGLLAVSKFSSFETRNIARWISPGEKTDHNWAARDDPKSNYITYR